jgi:biotin-(acetyl-CoA carboxylase) ligase
VDAIGRDSAHGAPALGNWNDWPDLMRYYRKHLFGLNQPVSFLQTADDNEIRGIFRGVSDHGAFVLESNGSQRELWAGDVMHLDFLG